MNNLFVRLAAAAILALTATATVGVALAAPVSAGEPGGTINGDEAPAPGSIPGPTHHG
jgi:hypothetical protein